MKKRDNHWVILSQYYPPEIGAPQIRLPHLAKNLRDHDIDVEILTAMPNYPIGKIFQGYQKKIALREEIDGVPIRRVWAYPAHGHSTFARLMSYFSFTLMAMFAVIFARRPHVMFVEGQPLSLGLVGLFMKWLRGVPYIFHVPDLQIDAAQQLGFIKSKVFLNLASRLENLFLKKAWKVSAPTHSMVQNLHERGLPHEQITLLPNGADSDFLRPQPASQELLERWRIRGKKPFVYVGTHSYYQGLDTILDAAKLLQGQKDIVFIFIGNGPERSRVIKRAEKLELSNVIFDELPFKELANIYSISYASIVPVRDIGVTRSMLPAKILPSLSCGVPVIYSGGGVEAADLINHGKCGICVRPEDGKSLVEAITLLASDPKGRAKMGLAGRELIVSEYNWKIIVTRWVHQLGIERQGSRFSDSKAS